MFYNNGIKQMQMEIVLSLHEIFLFILFFMIEKFPIFEI